MGYVDRDACAQGAHELIHSIVASVRHDIARRGITTQEGKEQALLQVVERAKYYKLAQKYAKDFKVIYGIELATVRRSQPSWNLAQARQYVIYCEVGNFILEEY